MQLCCWLDGILSLNYYFVLYLQSQSLTNKVLSNVREVSRVQVYPLTVWLTGTICKRSILPVTSIYLQSYHKCFWNLCLSIIWHIKRTFALGPSSCQSKWLCVKVAFIRPSHPNGWLSHLPCIRVTRTDVRKAIEHICDRLESSSKRKGGGAGGQAQRGLMF